MNWMFANTPRGNASSAGHLVEFKAGKSNLVAGPASGVATIVADNTKGLVFIKQSEDGLMHFYWKNRETGAVVDDLIIFPGDTEFMRVKECPDGKVFMLKFKSSDERRLFWIQEPAEDADKNLVEKVNETLNNPPDARSTRNASGGERSSLAAGLAGNAFSDAANDDINTLGGMDRQQLMQILSLVGNGSVSENANIAQQLLPSIPAQESAEESNTTAEGGQAAPLQSHLDSTAQGVRFPRAAARFDLGDAITGEKVINTVKNAAYRNRLGQHLPTVEDTSIEQEIINTVRAPQFRQAADAFGHAFQSGQLMPVLQQFNLSTEVTSAALSGDFLEFARKLTEAEKSETSSDTATVASTPATSSESAVGQEMESQSPDPVGEPTAKRGKPDEDQMDLD